MKAEPSSVDWVLLAVAGCLQENPACVCNAMPGQMEFNPICHPCHIQRARIFVRPFTACFDAYRAQFPGNPIRLRNRCDRFDNGNRHRCQHFPGFPPKAQKHAGEVSRAIYIHDRHRNSRWSVRRKGHLSLKRRHCCRHVKGLIFLDQQDPPIRALTFQACCNPPE